MMCPHETYMTRINLPSGKDYAAKIGNLQERYLRQRICPDVDCAFSLAVETIETMLISAIGQGNRT